MKVLGKGFLPGLQMDTLFYLYMVEREEASAFVFIRHKCHDDGSTLMTSYLPKTLSSDTVTLQLGFQKRNLGVRQIFSP